MRKFRRNFLSLPDVIDANEIPSGSDVPNGIISKIRTIVSASSITSYVEPSYYTEKSFYGYKEALVKWENYAQAQGQTAYLQVEFKQVFVYPTFYSLKGHKGKTFAKEWVLYGFNSLSEEKVTLSQNKSEGSTFCGTEGSCQSDNWATFSVDPVNKAFKYFRIVSLAQSALSPYLWIALGGFEVFGIYSLDGKTPETMRNKLKRMRTCVSNNRFSFFLTIIFSQFISR